MNNQATQASNVPARPVDNATAWRLEPPMIMDGARVPMLAYNITGGVYVGIRDLAFVFRGSPKQFGVTWNGAQNAIHLTSGRLYAPVGSEMTGTGASQAQASLVNSGVFLDGARIDVIIYRIGGANFYRLCDIARALDFFVGWDSAEETVVTDTRRAFVESARTALEELLRKDVEIVLFQDMIGETITSIAGTANRLNNIVLASAAVDGLVLQPGEEFSFNQVVGRRTRERGYLPAPAFSGGRTIQAVGGGICQVSSSIFSAIMDTDMLVTERRPHGQPVTYLPRGRDATVSWGTIDFRFVNNTIHPLRIDAKVSGRTLTVRVFGTLVFTPRR